MSCYDGLLQTFQSRTSFQRRIPGGPYKILKRLITYKGSTIFLQRLIGSLEGLIRSSIAKGFIRPFFFGFILVLLALQGLTGHLRLCFVLKGLKGL
jgi:hypothetical protein